jgi:hypothetical protein
MAAMLASCNARAASRASGNRPDVVTWRNFAFSSFQSYSIPIPPEYS